jgi:hypothetical protein
LVFEEAGEQIAAGVNPLVELLAGTVISNYGEDSLLS